MPSTRAQQRVNQLLGVGVAVWLARLGAERAGATHLSATAATCADLRAQRLSHGRPLPDPAYPLADTHLFGPRSLIFGTLHPTRNFFRLLTVDSEARLQPASAHATVWTAQSRTRQIHRGRGAEAADRGSQEIVSGRGRHGTCAISGTGRRSTTRDPPVTGTGAATAGRWRTGARPAREQLCLKLQDVLSLRGDDAVKIGARLCEPSRRRNVRSDVGCGAKAEHEDAEEEDH